jgi:amino acid transporter
MPNKHKTTSIKDQPTKKKIGFFSAILLVIGSSIGAGIFFKNGEILRNVQGSIILSLVS